MCLRYCPTSYHLALPRDYLLGIPLFVLPFSLFLRPPLSPFRKLERAGEKNVISRAFLRYLPDKVNPSIRASKKCRKRSRCLRPIRQPLQVLSRDKMTMKFNSRLVYLVQFSILRSFSGSFRGRPKASLVQRPILVSLDARREDERYFLEGGSGKKAVYYLCAVRTRTHARARTRPPAPARTHARTPRRENQYLDGQLCLNREEGNASSELY